MAFFLRGFEKSRWIGVDDYSHLSGEAITIDLRAQKNEWSFYKTESVDNESVDKIAIETVLKTVGYLSSILRLACVPESDLSEFGCHMDDLRIEKTAILGCEHVEIVPVNLNAIVLFSKYLLKNSFKSNFFKDYDSTEIWEVVKKMDRSKRNQLFKSMDKNRKKSLKNFLGKSEGNDPVFIEIFGKEGGGK
ncbi:MAG: hypothetical protein LKJ88_03260 [Bacilli bacterium]|jgi:hypothetical protein|nr:hypothetical protein [Bacilli bacterium]